MRGDIPRPEYPRPQIVRKDWLNLNGEWEFEIDHGCSGKERGLQHAERLKERILVPFCPESQLSGIGYRDFMAAVWYRRALSIPEEWANRRILLHIGACDFHTTVYVNGRCAGTHSGGYTPFAVDITDFLGKGWNSLTICAEDNTRSPSQASGKQSERFHSYGCMYTRTTGIWQTVWLEPVPAVFIENLRITPQMEAEAVVVEVLTSGFAPGRRNESQNFLVRAKVTANGEDVGSAEAVLCGRSAVLQMKISEARPWSPQDPFLYDLNVELLDQSGGVVDSVQSYFGLRSLNWDGPALKLNGVPLFQRLVLDQGFYPDGVYTAPSDEALRRDIELSKAMGFNGARLHQKVFEPRFLYWADKLGYLVWGEMPSWGLGLRDYAGINYFTQEWIAVLNRDYSHPSIVGWCPFNETGPEGPETLRTIYRLTKAMDPTRPCIDTSGYVHVETDLYDVHDYDQNPETFKARYAPFAEGGEPFRNNPQHDAPYQGQPYWVSEYGGIWWNPGQKDEKGWGYGQRPNSEAEFLARYRALTETLLRHPRMCAFCYTQLTDVEQEVNGLHTYDRRPKFDPEIIRAINSQPAAVEQQ